MGSPSPARPVKDMPGVIYEFHSIFSTVVLVFDVVAAFVGLSIVNPVRRPSDMSGKICGSSGCYAQALGVVDVGSLSVELSGGIRVRNGRPSCRALQGQNHGVRRGCRGLEEVRQSA